MSENFITNIKINKVRHLENLEIELSKNEKKHLILTGKNGSGKTSILEAIKFFIKDVMENKTEQENERGFISDAQLKRSMRNHIINKIDRDIDIEFTNIENICDKFINGNFILDYFHSKRSTNVNLPEGVEKVNLQSSYDIDDKIDKIFIQYMLDLKTQQSFARNEGDEDVAERIGEWFNNFESALKDIFEDKNLNLKFNYKNYEFKIIQEGREPFGFDVLSDGYSSILNIVMDLILRMESQKGYYSQNEYRQYIYDIEGIVLIDEVETHLHIELQKKIMPFLMKLFPKIQFIVSTHSPFVLSSVDNAVIYDLENKIQG